MVYLAFLPHRLSSKGIDMVKPVLKFGMAGLAFMALGAALAVWVVDQRSNYWSVPSQLERHTLTFFRGVFGSPDKSSPDHIITNRLELEKRTFSLPLSVAYDGGGITESPGGGILVIDRTGKIFLYDQGETNELDIDTPNNGLDELQRQVDRGELGSGAFRAKSFRFNDILAIEGDNTIDLFVSFSDWEPSRKCYRSILSQATIAKPTTVRNWVVRTEDWRELKVAEPCLPPREFGKIVEGIEAGGRLIAVSSSELVWSTGVYELDDYFKQTDKPPYAQREDSDYGRLFKIDTRTGRSKVLAQGMRNPQGLAASSNGLVYVTDHGMRGGDEINVIEPEHEEYNFGWPFATYGTHYNRQPVDVSGSHAGHQGYDQPLYSFVPSIAPSSILSIENFDPAWDGDLLVGGLMGTLERVHMVGDRVVLVETIKIDERTRDLLLTSDGKIVLWNDFRQLIFLTPSSRMSSADQLITSLEKVKNPQVRSAASNLLDACFNCHSLEKGIERSGPSLSNVCGQAAGTAEGYGSYSAALGSSRVVWTEELLRDFILEPQAVVPDTTMPWAGTTDRESATLIADLLCSPGLAAR